MVAMQQNAFSLCRSEASHNSIGDQMAFAPDERVNYLRVLKSLGFPAMTVVADRRTIAPLFPGKTRRTGVYVLALDDGLFYMGLAKDAVRRFGQHRRTFGRRIVGFAFKATAIRELEVVERDAIRLAERAGLPLEQVEWKSVVYGDSDLDDVLTADEFAIWRASPTHSVDARVRSSLISDAGRASRDRSNFSKLRDRPDAEDVIRLLRRYTLECVPSARITEHDFWSVSCLPSTNRTTWPRIACFNAHVMEVLVLGFLKADAKTAWGFLNVASSAIEAEFKSLAKARRALKVASITETAYRSAGHDQCNISFRGLSSLERLLDAPAVCEAAQLLLYRVMRKGVTPYAKFHCTALADVLLA